MSIQPILSRAHFFLLELPGWPVVDADQIAHQILADPTGLVV